MVPLCAVVLRGVPRVRLFAAQRLPRDARSHHPLSIPLGGTPILGWAPRRVSVAGVDTTVAPHDVPQVERSRADVFMRRLLRVDGAAPTGRAAAERVFSTSILISATRCLLTYIVLPFLAPILGVAAGVGPVLGIVIGVVAIIFNVMSMRRFWRADHRWRCAYTIIATVIICLLLVLLVRDVSELLT